MKKKYAWTMIEIIIAISTMFIISLALISGYRPNIQKQRLYLFTK